MIHKQLKTKGKEQVKSIQRGGKKMDYLQENNNKLMAALIMTD